MKKNNNISMILLSVTMISSIFNPIITSRVFAEPGDNKAGFTLSPLDEHIVLTPGESYTSSIKIANPSDTEKIEYEIEVQPFYVDEDYETIFSDVGNRSLVANWITIDSDKTGILSPHSMMDILYTINVPTDAPAGGQYADVRVISASSEATSNNGSSIGERIAIGHLIFAEIAGDTIRQGEIISADVPGFLLSGDIKGSSAIKNTGNTHGIASYKLQVFPLFSSEEIYTNEENPDSKTILPDRTLYNETTWKETPSVGIFNVIYTVEFEGVTTQVSKMVIICPIWLLFIIIFAIFAIIFYLFAKAKARKKSPARSGNSPAPQQ